MESLLERLCEQLAVKTTRRGFFRLTGKVTAAVAAAGAGFTRFYNEAAAANYACCSLAYPNNWCPCDPAVCGCPQPSTFWSWSCCQNTCVYACEECYFDAGGGCSYATTYGLGCNGGTCPQSPAP